MHAFSGANSHRLWESDGKTYFEWKIQKSDGKNHPPTVTDRFEAWLLHGDANLVCYRNDVNFSKKKNLNWSKAIDEIAVSVQNWILCKCGQKADETSTISSKTAYQMVNITMLQQKYCTILAYNSFFVEWSFLARDSFNTVWCVSIPRNKKANVKWLTRLEQSSVPNLSRTVWFL